MKKRIDILQPINVSGVYTVLKDPQTLKGFRVTVTYNGRSNIKQKRSNKIDVFPTKRGCKFGNVVYGDDKTSVDYIFRDGLFLPDSMARANDFKKDVEQIVNSQPVEANGVGKCFFSLRLKKWSMCKPIGNDSMSVGYGVTVNYPGNLTLNPLFKYHIEEPDVNVASVTYNPHTKMTEVLYYVSQKDYMNAKDAYTVANVFHIMICYRIAGTQRNENIK
ncbi:MAG: hypothetical protein J6W27_02630 [Alphaproteobacteria bacterium]|nr:hypothetical protein [Alphaproteobacteria bacterium]